MLLTFLVVAILLAHPNELPQEIFFIDRKTTESREIVQFELVGALDQANKKLPARQVTRNEFAGVGTFIN